MRKKMKRQFLIFIAIAAFATALATSASGQTGRTVNANVKFDFQIGERIFPAGDHRIDSISRESGNILRIRSVSDVNKQQFIIASHSSAGKRRSPKLSFPKIRRELFSDRSFSRFGPMGLFDSAFAPSARE
jgi:hypothetical protein